MDFDLNSELKTHNSELIGAGDSKTYGADIGPSGGQDMTQIDTLAGTVHDRSASAAEFTGGDSEKGLGGQAEPMAPGGIFYERRGF